MSNADNTQVGGSHYKLKDSSCEHWNYVVANDLCYFQAQITKYVTRFRKKNGVQDLLKARHFLDKLIELETAKEENMEEQQFQREIANSRKREGAA